MKFLVAAFSLCILASVQVLAQSALKVSLADRSRITVAVDGRYFNQRGESVTIGSLPPGRHEVKIFVVSQYGNGNGRQKLIYEGRVKTQYGLTTFLTHDPYRGSTVVSYDNGQQLNVNQPPVDQNNNYQAQPNGNAQQNTTANNNDYNNNSTTNTTTANDQAPGPVASPVSTDEVLNELPVKDAKIDKLKKKVTVKNTDTEKFTIVKDGLKKERLQTSQVCTVIDWFSFESTKLEFAEWAYLHTTDKQNYTKVKDKLTYNSYREELDKFLSGNK